MNRVLVYGVEITNTAKTSSEMFYGALIQTVIHEKATSSLHTCGALYVKTEKETIVYAPGAWKWVREEIGEQES